LTPAKASTPPILIAARSVVRSASEATVKVLMITAEPLPASCTTEKPLGLPLTAPRVCVVLPLVTFSVAPDRLAVAPAWKASPGRSMTSPATMPPMVLLLKLLPDIAADWICSSPKPAPKVIAPEPAAVPAFRSSVPPLCTLVPPV
jgi:hypothetical protein